MGGRWEQRCTFTVSHWPTRLLWSGKTGIARVVNVAVSPAAHLSSASFMTFSRVALVVVGDHGVSLQDFEHGELVLEGGHGAGMQGIQVDCRVAAGAGEVGFGGVHPAAEGAGVVDFEEAHDLGGSVLGVMLWGAFFLDAAQKGVELIYIFLRHFLCSFGQTFLSDPRPHLAAFWGFSGYWQRLSSPPLCLLGLPGPLLGFHLAVWGI